ncbi:hypothetical protein M2167_006329 [Streptomyces sp. SPB4]|nr:hypothetical protein [Streptomyces sp. SPB4]
MPETDAQETGPVSRHAVETATPAGKFRGVQGPAPTTLALSPDGTFLHGVHADRAGNIPDASDLTETGTFPSIPDKAPAPSPQTAPCARPTPTNLRRDRPRRRRGVRFRSPGRRTGGRGDRCGQRS